MLSLSLLAAVRQLQKPETATIAELSAIAAAASALVTYQIEVPVLH